MVISAQAFIKVQGWRMKASGMPDSSTSPSKEGLSCRWKEAAETRGFDLQIHPSEWKVEHFVQLALHEVPEHGAVQSKTEARLSVLKVLLQDPEPPGRAACCCFHHRPMAAPKTCSLVRGTAPPATRYRRHTWQGDEVAALCSDRSAPLSKWRKWTVGTPLLCISSFPLSQKAPLPANTWLWANLGATDRHTDHRGSAHLGSRPCLRSSPCVEHFKELLSFFIHKTSDVPFFQKEFFPCI